MDRSQVYRRVNDLTVVSYRSKHLLLCVVSVEQHSGPLIYALVSKLLVFFVLAPSCSISLIICITREDKFRNCVNHGGLML